MSVNRSRAIGFALMSAVMALAACESPQERIASILRLPSLPASVQGAHCEEPFTTDVLTYCSIEIAPDDFPALLEGWEFRRDLVEGDTRSQWQWATLPHGFEMAEEYVVEPAEFESGGHVMVVTDASRRYVIVDLYVE